MASQGRNSGSVLRANQFAFLIAEAIGAAGGGSDLLQQARQGSHNLAHICRQLSQAVFAQALLHSGQWQMIFVLPETKDPAGSLRWPQTWYPHMADFK